MKTPPRIVSEGNNKFLRITGSAGDKQSIPGEYPNRNRSTKFVTPTPSAMPRISSGTMRQYYSADIRTDAKWGAIMEWFQNSPERETYWAVNNTGPVARFSLKDGHLKFRSYYASQTKYVDYDLGRVDPNKWYKLELKAVWSHDPGEGRLEAYVNGRKFATISGRGVNLGPKSHKIPGLKFGLYGDNAVGTIDVDNVVIKGW